MQGHQICLSEFLVGDDIAILYPPFGKLSGSNDDEDLVFVTAEPFEEHLVLSKNQVIGKASPDQIPMENASMVDSSLADCKKEPIAFEEPHPFALEAEDFFGADSQEYGRMAICVEKGSILYGDFVEEPQAVWMSFGDELVRLPEGLNRLAKPDHFRPILAELLIGIKEEVRLVTLVVEHVNISGNPLHQEGGGKTQRSFLNRKMNDEELLQMVELEVRELLNSYEFLGDDVPFVSRSALLVFEALMKYPSINRGEDKWIYELMDSVDNYISIPAWQTDLPFLMTVEDVFSITGRGPIATGRVERGMVKVGETVEIVGLEDNRVSTVTGWDFFASNGPNTTTSCLGPEYSKEVLTVLSIVQCDVLWRLSIVQYDMLWRQLIRSVREQNLVKLKNSSLTAM